MKVWKPLEDGTLNQDGEIVASLSKNGTLFAITDGVITNELRFKTEQYRLCQLVEQPVAPDDVMATIRMLLLGEREAIKEYHYDVYGSDDLAKRLAHIDKCLAWLDTLAQKGDE